MTTTDTTLDVRAVLKRADQRYTTKTGDDPSPPEYIDALTLAVRSLIDTPADTSELARLQALVDDQRTRLDDDARTISRQQGEISALKMERDQLAAAPAHDPAEVRRQVERAVAAGKAEADQLRAQCDELRIDLAAAKKALAEAVKEAETWQREYERIRDDALDEMVERAHPEHTHAYPLDPLTGAIGPCSCNLIYPRDTLAAHQAATADQSDDEEPLADLIQRIRHELGDWGKP